MSVLDKYIITKNNKSVDLKAIPVLTYNDFSSLIKSLLQKTENHCLNYFAYPSNDKMQLIACIASDSDASILIFSHVVAQGEELESLSAEISALHIFEREIFENYGVKFKNHPWLKPVRYSKNRFDNKSKIKDYPFYSIQSDELHEVGVGPIHAGIIEPGHFRFICNGEDVLHLEIQLGYQHRGVEQLFLEKKKVLQRNILAESIAGDTAVGHSLAFAQIMESLGNISISEQLSIERAMALELERIAIHVGDIAALCTDIGYSLGANIFAILRTLIINFTQSWCGNRLGKGMIRVGGTNQAFNNDLKKKLIKVLDDFEFQFNELAHRTFKLPSVENRFDNIGTISETQARNLGVVGMTARMANVLRDIRHSHPFAGFEKYPIPTLVLPNGDVFSRFLLRRKEVKQSIAWIRNILDCEKFENPAPMPVTELNLEANKLCIGLTEAWRGEICHCAITDNSGQLTLYKIKDPSLHNWKALELSLRNVEISDFPINNKSYNLSYCGHDL